MDQIVRRPDGAQAQHPDRPPVDDINRSLGLDPAGRRGTRRRRWLVVLVLAALALAAAAWWIVAPAEAPVVAYRTAPVERGPLTIEVSATGTIQPFTQVDISSELSGVVRAVNVQENGTVKRGDVLAELDTARLSAQVERAEANVSAAQARVGEAQATLKETDRALTRSQSLAERGLAADQVLDTAVAARDRAASALETAEANLAVARADLRLQEADLSKSTIYSPIDGVILTRSVDPGQTVASSFSAPVLFVIAEDLTRMQLQAAVDEADIGSVAIGQSARFTVDAFPGRSFEATISDIAYGAVTTEGVVTYEAKLTVDNPDLLLRPGMTATVAIVTREDSDVLTAPTAAFRFTPPTPDEAGGRGFSLQSIFMPRMGRGGRGGRERERPPATADDGTRTLYVLRDGQPVAVPVKAGATDGDRIEILSGVSEGDAIVVGIRTGDRR